MSGQEDKEQLPSQIYKAVHDFFPFTRASLDSFYYIPDWIKMFLYESFTLKEVKNAIRYNNSGFEREEDLYKQKVPFVLNDDIYLMPFTEEEYHNFMVC